MKKLLVLFLFFIFNRCYCGENCECVPFYQCKDGVVAVNGSPDTINNRFGEDSDVKKCKDDELCCVVPTFPDEKLECLTEEKINIPLRPSKAGCGYRRIENVTQDYSLITETADNEPEEMCICVPYYQCEGGEILVHGSPHTINTKLEGESIPQCREEEICCKPPKTTMQDQETTGCQNKRKIPRKRRTSELEDLSEAASNSKEYGVLEQYQSSKSKDSTFFGEFPWMVALIQIEDGKEKYLCGGSIISPSHVLTAAHCVNQINETSSLIVRAGEWDPNTNKEPLSPEDRYAITITIHENFKPFNLINNIALIKVDKLFDWSIAIDRICVDEVNFTSVNCFVTGWKTKGKYPETKNKNNLDWSDMKQAEMNIIDRKTCERKLKQTVLGKYFQLHSSFICAEAAKGYNACKGDGGGPLVCSGYNGDKLKYVQVGISAWGIDCKKNPSIYTNIKYFYKWIFERVFL